MIAVAGTGSIVDRLGVRLEPVAGADATALLGVALRRNPLRAHLLVSRVLGKHIPSDPRAVRAAGLLLGLLVADVLAGRPPRALPTERLHAAAAGDRAAAAALHASLAPEGPTDALVLGFAETATALGHCVAEALVSDYLHSTRREVPGVTAAGGFTEEHSHATSHTLLPTDPDLMRGGRPLVLVDDELSTGRTALNTITALHRAMPRERYVVAALVDARPPDSDLVEAVAALGARLDVVSLATARVELPADVIARAAALRSEIDRRADLPTRGGASVGSDAGALPAPLEVRALGWPAGLAVGGRHGFAAADHAAFATALAEVAVPGLEADPAERTLVLGTEELMQLPLRLAQVLADAAGPEAAGVWFSTSTRSPAVVVDEPDYALRTGLVFAAHDGPADGPGRRYAYNLATGDPDAARGGGPAWDRVVVVVDPPGDTPALRSGLLRALAPHTRRTTLLVTP
ncbi:phosphoribosyltransferase domain-containing protein [Pseudonocardia humida]|uniref:Phosphoribosyltransferase domain-containing protein n=1 Tax=Pseudonocardia humida TaxID=2800819 RepID=A0ABT0ZRV4_9PSEU|nr:phosphoribosyltransferase domain-containing protein [Pseudonocardia humida]MCO1653455.1 phosphoribosyltransferase domain-containing protein [Pseudonocardia humida]